MSLQKQENSGVVSATVELEFSEEVLKAFLLHLRFKISNPPNTMNDIEFTSVLEQIYTQLAQHEEREGGNNDSVLKDIRLSCLCRHKILPNQHYPSGMCMVSSCECGSQDRLYKV